MLARHLRKTGGARDPDFDKVGLLLPFPGDFNDASLGRFTPTINGDPEAYAANSAYFQNGAIGGFAVFDGTGDYLSFANQSEFQIGAGDFTIETFFSVSSLSATRTIASHGVSASNGWNIRVLTDGTIRFDYGASSTVDTASGVVTGTSGDKYYFKFGRDAGVFKRVYARKPSSGPFIPPDGWESIVSSTLSSSSYNFDTSSALNIGASRANGSLLNGTLAQFRLTVGKWRTGGRPLSPFPIR